jgi:hypothetical protein
VLNLVETEIQERKEWLDEMIALGQGDAYKRSIQQEIRQVFFY